MIGQVPGSRPSEAGCSGSTLEKMRVIHIFSSKKKESLKHKRTDINST